MGEKTNIYGFAPGMNPQTAEWVNKQHKKIEANSRKLVNDAISIGEVLYSVQKKCKHGSFLKWLSDNVCFTDTSAYKYIALFNFKELISNAENLTKAYKTIETVMKQEKEKEETKSKQRIAVYQETGKKPEGWRRGTDDKKAKENTVCDKKTEAKKKAAKDNKSEDTKKAAAAEKKEFNESEQDNRNDELFNDILADYLGQFANKSRKIIACQNIIKMCRKVLDDLQW